MYWHTEYHMYAGVPCYNLRKLARSIAADMPAPRTLLGAWREMLQIWNRQLEDPDYQYDTRCRRRRATQPNTRRQPGGLDRRDGSLQTALSG